MQALDPPSFTFTFLEFIKFNYEKKGNCGDLTTRFAGAAFNF